MNKTLYILFVVANVFAQIQKGGLPEFYNERLIDIEYRVVDSQQIIDRNFHPMVFQFGHEYEFNLNMFRFIFIISGFRLRCWCVTCVGLLRPSLSF